MAITILGVSSPVGKKPYDEIPFSVLTDVPGTVGSITLVENGDPKCAIELDFNGATASGKFPKGTVFTGTYVVVAFVTDGVDSDFSTDALTVLPIDDAVDVLQTAFVEAIQATLVASSLLDEIPDQDIHTDVINHKQRSRLNPGIIITRRPIQIPGFTTFDSEEWIFNAEVLVTTKNNYKGERDQADRRAIIRLMSNIRIALRANEYLGFLHKPLLMTDIERFRDALNDTQFWERIMVTGRFLNLE